jgi:hypothetical protein
MTDDGTMDSSDDRELRSGEIVASVTEMHRVIQRLEEEFGVMLPDDELASVQTAGQLYRLIQLELTTQPMLSPASAFHRLRRALQASPRTSHTLIRPSTQLVELMPRPNRAHDWQLLASSTNLTLAPLRPLRWVRDAVRILTGLAATFAFVGMVLATRPFGLLWFPPILMAVFVGLVTYRILFVITQSLVLEFPQQTLRELAQSLVETYPEQFQPGLPPMAPEVAWQRFTHILAQELRMDPADIHPEFRIFLQGPP